MVIQQFSLGIVTNHTAVKTLYEVDRTDDNMEVISFYVTHFLLFNVVG